MMMIPPERRRIWVRDRAVPRTSLSDMTELSQWWPIRWRQHDDWHSATVHEDRRRVAPDTSVWTVLDLPRRDGRLSWPMWQTQSSAWHISMNGTRLTSPWGMKGWVGLYDRRRAAPDTSVWTVLDLPPPEGWKAELAYVTDTEQRLTHQYERYWTYLPRRDGRLSWLMWQTQSSAWHISMNSTRLTYPGGMKGWVGLCDRHRVAPDTSRYSTYLPRRMKGWVGLCDRRRAAPDTSVRTVPTGSNWRHGVSSQCPLTDLVLLPAKAHRTPRSTCWKITHRHRYQVQFSD